MSTEENKYAWLRSESIIRGAFKSGIDIDKAYDARPRQSAIFAAERVCDSYHSRVLNGPCRNCGHRQDAHKRNAAAPGNGFGQPTASPATGWAATAGNQQAPDAGPTTGSDAAVMSKYTPDADYYRKRLEMLLDAAAANFPERQRDVYLETVGGNPSCRVAIPQEALRQLLSGAPPCVRTEDDAPPYPLTPLEKTVAESAKLASAHGLTALAADLHEALTELVAAGVADDAAQNRIEHLRKNPPVSEGARVVAYSRALDALHAKHYAINKTHLAIAQVKKWCSPRQRKAEEKAR